MAQPEQAADTSMEEILSSIRKIIAEDHDDAGGETPHLEIVAGHESAEQDRGAGDIEEERMRDKPAAETEDKADRNPAREGSAAKGASVDDTELTDVDDDVRGAETSALEETVAAVGDQDKDAELEVGEAEGRNFDLVEPSAADAFEDDEASAPEQERDESELVDTRRSGAPAAGSADDRLLSPRAGEAVHSAFDQLADIILSDQARTLEDIVKDIMRPMLQHWLDDNLPVLVERLVREEIERVSRGRR